MKRNSRIALSPVADFSAHSSKETQVAFNVGYDGLMYFVFALRPLNYRDAKGTFALTQPAQPQRYRVVALDGNRVALDFIIENEPFNIHHIAPLPEGVLLACGRSHFRSKEDFEKNGRIYGLDGKFQRDLLLGDGIQNLQTTASGAIWASFFDEGIFGNYGWNEPVGASGLVAWNSDGEMIYNFEPNAELDSMCDCYALNVVGEGEVWCYYYTEFPLVRIKGKEIAASWNIPVAGADAFAVEKYYALFRGGYGEHDVYRLFRLEENNIVEKKRFEVVDEKGMLLIADSALSVGGSIYLLDNLSVYRLDIALATSAQ